MTNSGPAFSRGPALGPFLALSLHRHWAECPLCARSGHSRKSAFDPKRTMGRNPLSDLADLFPCFAGLKKAGMTASRSLVKLRTISMDIQMPDILIHCPMTGQAVPTRLGTEVVIFETLPDIPPPLKCPRCGQMHFWKPKEAWVGRSAELTRHQTEPHTVRRPIRERIDQHGSISSAVVAGAAVINGDETAIRFWLTIRRHPAAIGCMWRTSHAKSVAAFPDRDLPFHWRRGCHGRRWYVDRCWLTRSAFLLRSAAPETADQGRPRLAS